MLQWRRILMIGWWKIRHKSHLQKLELEVKESKEGMCNEGTEGHSVQITWSVQKETELVKWGANKPTQVTRDSGAV
jgi:hypothetical protein